MELGPAKIAHTRWHNTGADENFLDWVRRGGVENLAPETARIGRGGNLGTGFWYLLEVGFSFLFISKTGFLGACFEHSWRCSNYHQNVPGLLKCPLGAYVSGNKNEQILAVYISSIILAALATHIQSFAAPWHV